MARFLLVLLVLSLYDAIRRACAAEEVYVDSGLSHLTLSVGELGLVRYDETGEPLTRNLYQVGLPATLRAALVELCDTLGITSLFTLLVGEHPLPEGSSTHVNLKGQNWLIQRPGDQYQSNMHWISPGDAAAQEGFLQALGDGGFDHVLDGEGNTLALDGIFCYHLTLIAVSHCDEGYLHHDFIETGNKAFNLIVPLILVPDSTPELDVEDENGFMTGLKYEYDTGIMLGDDANHATAAVDYDGTMRMMATIYMADVNEDNVERILNQYTQEYPPAEAEFLLKHRGVHWGNGTKLPKRSCPRSLDLCSEAICTNERNCLS